MRPLFVSFAVGLGVGVLYGLLRIKSPAPPVVALLGLLGMVIGEQVGTWPHIAKLDVSQATSVAGQRPPSPGNAQARFAGQASNVEREKPITSQLTITAAATDTF